MRIKTILFSSALFLGVIGCQNDDLEVSPSEKISSPMDAYMELKSGSIDNPEVTITPEFLDQINEDLEQRGENYRVYSAELMTAGGSEEKGQTVISKVTGNKQVDADFVPNDTRRKESAGGGSKITYAIDQTYDAVPPFGGLTADQTTEAIERAFSTWRDVKSTDPGLIRNPDLGWDIGVVAYRNRLGGSPYIFADIQLAGWRDINFGGSVLGVTFTFVFYDENGQVTDINNDGKVDVMFREIYFDPNWNWANDGSTNIDLESVALHEIGHALSQDHFGKVALKKGELKASPRAVMNAVYIDPLRELQGTDKGGHSSIWSSWPNN